MKILLLAFLSFLSVKANAQTYYYSKLVKQIIVEQPGGQDEIRTIENKSGPYKVVFEIPVRGDSKDLFTLCEPGVSELESPWFGHLMDVKYIQRDNILFHQCIYSDTREGGRVTVLIAQDHSQMIILKPDNTIWKYIK